MFVSLPQHTTAATMDPSSSSSATPATRIPHRHGRSHRRAVSSPKNVSAEPPMAVSPSTSFQSISTYHLSSSSIMTDASSSKIITPSRTTSSSIFGSVKRTLTIGSKRKHNEPRSKLTSGMYSTPEERGSPNARQARQFPPPSFPGLLQASPPSVEQIAMGLHVSRTPHLGPLQGGSRNPYTYGGRNHSSPAVHASHASRSHPALPPPPARSSMKKPTKGSISSSSSQPMVTGLAPPPPASSPTPTSTSTSARSPSLATDSTTNSSKSTGSSSGAFTWSRFRMGRFLGVGNRSAASSIPSSSLISTPLSSPRESIGDLDGVKKAVRFEEEGPQIVRHPSLD
ncbi:hypothetical protein BKA70DRAFT_475443 [Coprinopsis sp. MPI-PUGE-AT-0042]|nr:hypothetical protein BKA70DRAFT_475443 [Coprinopsis sp. MPI-PUGE-AT-0042]